MAIPLDPISIGGAILGGLFGGQSSTQTQTANREPWAPAQDLLKSQITNTGQLQNYYQQNPFSPMQQAAYRNAFAQNDSMRAAAPGVLQRLSSNQYFDRGQPLKMPQAFNFTPKTNDSLGLSGNAQALSPLLDSLFSNPYSNGAIKPMTPLVPAMGANTMTAADGQGGQGGNYASTSTPDYATAYSLAKMIGSPALMGYVTDGILGSSNNAAREADAMPSTTMGLAQGYDGPGSNQGGGNVDAGTAPGVAGVSDVAGPAGAGDTYAKGGLVNMAPQKNNPPGPDDGYAALDNGEYVVRKSAVNKYGQGLLDAINQGKLPAKALRGLL
jgi:hypothetical protein